MKSKKIIIVCLLAVMVTASVLITKEIIFPKKTEALYNPPYEHVVLAVCLGYVNNLSGDAKQEAFDDCIEWWTQ